MRTLTVGLMLILLVLPGCAAVEKRCVARGGEWSAWSGCYNAVTGDAVDVSPYRDNRPLHPAAAAFLFGAMQGMNQPARTPLYQPKSLAPALNCQSFGVGSSVQTTCY